MNEMLRTQIAASIMSGLAAGYNPHALTNGRFIPAADIPVMAMCAVEMTDALLKELSKDEAVRDALHDTDPD